MSVEAFRTDVIVFYVINLLMRVANWPNIFVDQDQLSYLDLISSTHQRENVQFADIILYYYYIFHGKGTGIISNYILKEEKLGPPISLS